MRPAAFEDRIADDLKRIDAAMDEALAEAETRPDGTDRVFLTGGFSLIPAVRAGFDRRLVAERIVTGGEFTSIAHGLEPIGGGTDPAV